MSDLTHTQGSSWYVLSLPRDPIICVMGASRLTELFYLSCRAYRKNGRRYWKPTRKPRPCRVDEASDALIKYRTVEFASVSGFPWLSMFYFILYYHHHSVRVMGSWRVLVLWCITYVSCIPWPSLSKVQLIYLEYDIRYGVPLLSNLLCLRSQVSYPRKQRMRVRISM